MSLNGLDFEPSSDQLVEMAATPGSMATLVSGGRWRMEAHHALVDRHVVDLIARRIPQRVLLVREPPRHGKSEHLSHWTPAWYLATRPDKDVLLCGYSQDFARTYGRRSRDTYEKVAPCFGPVVVNKDRRGSTSWGTTAGGGLITAGVATGIGGRPANLLIVDDLIKNSQDAQSEAHREMVWEWFLSTAMTRLEPDGVCVAIGTSWHRDDVLERIKQRFEGDCLEVCLPAIAEHDDPLGREPGRALWPERFAESQLAEIERTLGPYYWSALYQQRPLSHEDAEWPAELFDGILIDDHEWPASFEISCLALDPAQGKKGGDYAAIIFLGLAQGKLYVDADLTRTPASGLVQRLAAIAERTQPDAVGVETDMWQELLLTEFTRYCAANAVPPYPVYPLPTKGVPKETRIRRLGGWLQQRRIKVRRSRSGTLLVEQLRDFPLADHDDGPDCCEMGLRLLNSIVADQITREQDGILVPI